MPLIKNSKILVAEMVQLQMAIKLAQLARNPRLTEPIVSSEFVLIDGLFSTMFTDEGGYRRGFIGITDDSLFVYLTNKQTIEALQSSHAESDCRRFHSKPSASCYNLPVDEIGKACSYILNYVVNGLKP